MSTPKKIVVTRTFTYDVQEVMNSIRDVHNDQKMKLTLDDVWDLVSEWAHEDMRSPASRHDLVWLDENGNQIN